MKNRRRHLAAIASAATALLVFQNCGPFVVSHPEKQHQSSYNFSSMGQDALQPSTDKLDAGCMLKTEYDACLFLKNPVAQRQAALSTQSSTVSSNLASVQIYGVKLTGLTSTTTLDNGTIHVESIASTQPVPSNLKTTAATDTGRTFSQVHIYYWMNRATEFMSRRTGVFPAQSKSIRVIVDDSLSGWAPHINTIHLHTSDSGNAMAWSPELAIHFLGLANLYYASNGAIEPPSATTHTICNLKPAGCCTSVTGCSRAIASGVGDYMAGVIFPTQTQIGETWINSVDGLASCGQSRALDSAAQRPVSTAYSACSGQGRTGDVSAMGTIYASIWWEVRKASIKQNPVNGDVEIDTLFMNHLYDLDGTDDFKTALVKIRNIDKIAFQGRHVPLFEAQFAARGL